MHTLNDAQKRAAKQIQGPVLVIAGAGSGKTRVITHKIGYLIQQHGFNPSNIAALTFTNKAAKEMKHRISHTLGDRAKGLMVSTFHTFGLSIIKKARQLNRQKPEFSLFDQQDSMMVLKELACHVSELETSQLQNVQHKISLWKNAMILPGQVQPVDKFEELAARFYALYEPQLYAYNAIDFDDLILKPLALFKEFPEVKAYWQNKIRYLLVDEYQDTNTCQYRLIQAITGPLANFTVVGDDDQSIYSWRGARPENLLQLQQDYPQLSIVPLEQNYRSTRTILKAANGLISHNPHLISKQLWSTLQEGDKIRVLPCEDEEAEAERIVCDLMSHHFHKGARYLDYAILYRSNHQSRLLEKVLRNYKIPYQITGGVSFFSREEIKDCLAYCRLLVNSDDDTAFLRIINTPPREIGSSTLEKLGLYAQQRQCSLFAACFEMGLRETLPEKTAERLETFGHWINLVADNAQRGDTAGVINEFFTTLNYDTFVQESAPNAKAGQKKLENVIEFRSWLNRLLTQNDSPLTLNEAVHRFLLIDRLDRDSNESANDAVQLLTLHAAKGLEFKHVYLVGMEEGQLPHHNSQSVEQIEEERRLAYVGITRAQESLSLSYVKNRKRFNETDACTPSRFLSEIPEDCLDWECGANKNPEKSKQQGLAHLGALRAMLE